MVRGLHKTIGNVETIDRGSREFVNLDPEYPELDTILNFMPDGERIVDLALPSGDYIGLEYRVFVCLPGTEHWPDGGRWQRHDGTHYFGLPALSYEE
jgi:hypothetical protein